MKKYIFVLFVLITSVSIAQSVDTVVSITLLKSDVDQITINLNAEEIAALNKTYGMDWKKELRSMLNQKINESVRAQRASIETEIESIDESTLTGAQLKQAISDARKKRWQYQKVVRK